MYDTLREWFHGHPGLGRALWVTIVVAIATICGTLIAIEHHGGSSERLSAGAPTTLVGALLADPTTLAAPTTEPLVSVLSVPATGAVATTVPQGTGLTIPASTAPGVATDPPPDTSPADTPTTFVIPTTSPPSTTTTTQPESKECVLAVVAEHAAQNFGEAGRVAAVNQIQPNGVILQQALKSLVPFTSAPAKATAVQFLSIIQDALNTTLNVPPDQILAAYLKLQPQAAPIGVSLFAQLRPGCPQLN